MCFPPPKAQHFMSVHIAVCCSNPQLLGSATKTPFRFNRTGRQATFLKHNKESSLSSHHPGNLLLFIHLFPVHFLTLYSEQRDLMFRLEHYWLQPRVLPWGTATAALRELSEKAAWDVLAAEIALSSKLLKSSQVSAAAQLLRAPSA